jgi:hypothetical protein
MIVIEPAAADVGQIPLPALDRAESLRAARLVALRRSRLPSWRALLKQSVPAKSQAAGVVRKESEF